MKKVVKFGGSSLASAEQFRKVGEIIHAEKERRYVVPSAPGKRYSGDTKVTDMLYDCYNSASANGDISGKIKAIQARYQEIIDGLGLELSLDEQFAEIREKFEEGVGKRLRGIQRRIFKRYCNVCLSWIRICGCCRGNSFR